MLLIIYIRLPVRYKQAAFCYEELILSQPTVPLCHLAYADVSNFFMNCYLIYFGQIKFFSLSLVFLAPITARHWTLHWEMYRRNLARVIKHYLDLMVLPGTLYAWWIRKYPDCQEILHIHYWLNWRQEYQSTLWYMLGELFLSVLPLFNLSVCFVWSCTGSCVYDLNIVDVIWKLVEPWFYWLQWK